MIKELLDDLASEQAELWVDGNKLRYCGPENVFTTDRLALIGSMKNKIIEYLKETNYSFKCHKLSHNQRSLWFLYKTAPKSPAYNAAFATRILSKVNIPAMHVCFQKLAARHELLRATFENRDGEVYQNIHAYPTVSLEETHTGNIAQEELHQQVTLSYKNPFDLYNGPVYRVHFFHCGEEDHIMLLCIHHIICDGWSLWILIDELKSIYLSETKQGIDSLIPIKRSYENFVNWQEEMLSGPKGQKLANYWKQQLSGALTALQIPADRSRPDLPTYNGGALPFYLNSTLTGGLKKLAKSESITLYTLILTAFQILLFKYTGQVDILVGTPMTGRGNIEFNRNVGHFINPVVIRGNLSGDPLFKNLINKTQKAVVGAIANQDFPFNLLVETINPTRDPRRSPVFQVMLVLQKPQVKGDIISLIIGSQNKDMIKWGDMILEPFLLTQQEGQFDLTLNLIESDNSLYGMFSYNKDLFDENTIKRMIFHFETLLNGIIVNPDRRLSQLPILQNNEKKKIITIWNDTRTEYPSHLRVHECFEKQVLKTPDHKAIVHPDGQLTYRELNENANMLARDLRARDVGKGAVVALVLEHSAHRVIAMLAVMKAGGSWLPVSPKYPAQRKQFLIEDSKAHCIIADRDIDAKNSSWCKNISAHNIMRIDKNIGYSNDARNLGISGKPNDLAYIMYTSGTTGNPKGVMIEHRGVVNTLTWFGQTYGIGPGVNLIQLTDFTFDPSVEQIFGSLLHGATIHIPEEGILNDKYKFSKFIKENKIHIVNFIPNVLEKLLCGQKRIETLRAVIVGGERLRESVKNRLINIGYPLFNHYGPTEGTIEVLAGRCNPKHMVTLGKPIANMKCYILDDYLEPVPIGVLGELYISGPGVARGYLKNEKLTRLLFKSNPYAKGERLYRTGDMVRWGCDGSIEFIGRRDRQIKIEGHRIEVEEIECLLNKHPNINMAAVKVIYNNAQRCKWLCAYIYPKGKQASSENLRDYLSDSLPDYMIPARFVFMKNLPTLNSDKIDYGALPEPEDKPEVYAIPRDDIEQTLTQVLKSVLKLDTIGVHTNFYELGCNSLTFLTLHSKIEEHFPGSLQLTDIIRYPTVSGLRRQLIVKNIKTKKEARRSTQLKNFFNAINNSNTHSKADKKFSKASIDRAAVISGFFKRAYDEDTKVVFINNIMATEVFFAMNVLPFNVEVACGLLTHAKAAPEFINTAEQKHFSRDVCSIARCALGAAYQDCLPTPDAIALSSYPCDSSTKILYHFGEMYEVPRLILDIPYCHDEKSIIFLASQIRAMVKQLEKIFDEKMDHNKLMEAIHYSNKVQNDLKNINELCMEKPVPIDVEDAMDLMSGIYLLGTKAFAETTRQLLKEVRKRALKHKNNNNSIKRILWHGLRPAYSDQIIKYIKEICGFEILSEVNLSATSVYNYKPIITDDPYRAIAHKLITMSASGPIKQFFNQKNLDNLRNYHLDGVISFSQWGCRHMTSVHQIARQALAKMKLPVLEIDGDSVDNRNYSFAQIKNRIDAFAEIINERS